MTAHLPSPLHCGFSLTSDCRPTDPALLSSPGKWQSTSLVLHGASGSQIFEQFARDQFPPRPYHRYRTTMPSRWLTTWSRWLEPAKKRSNPISVRLPLFASLPILRKPPVLNVTELGFCNR